MIAHIYARTKDTELLSYAMEAVMDSGFSLAYRNQVLNFLLPLFPTLTAKSPHIHAVTRLLVALSDSLHAIKLLARLVPDELLVAYQLAFDLAEGGSQEFTRNVSDGLPKDDVSMHDMLSYSTIF
jgi:26S proteasome regulatory subunit N2